MKKLTERQVLVLNFINLYQQEHSYPPTYRDIAKEFKISAKGAYDHVKAIESKGINTKKKRRVLDTQSKLIMTKNALRSKTRRMVRDGLLPHKPCMICGNMEVHAHHLKYSVADSVLWLCAKHHRQWHQLMKIERSTIDMFQDYWNNASLSQ